MQLLGDIKTGGGVQTHTLGAISEKLQSRQ